VNVGAVGRSQVPDEPRGPHPVDPRVPARHRVAIDLDVAVAAAPDHDLVGAERPPAAHVRAGRVDEDQTALAVARLRLEDLDLRDPGLPFAHELIDTLTGRALVPQGPPLRTRPKFLCIAADCAVSMYARAGTTCRASHLPAPRS